MPEEAILGLIAFFGTITFIVVMTLVGLSMINDHIFRPLGDAGDEVARAAGAKLKELLRHYRHRNR